MAKNPNNLLRHPFRYPEWGEMLLAGMGFLQFAFALYFYKELDERKSMELIIYFSAAAWASGGLILGAGHLAALYRGRTNRGYKARLYMAGLSLVFWSHSIISIVTSCVFFGGPLPGTLVPALASPLLAGAVLYRLWRRC